MAILCCVAKNSLRGASSDTSNVSNTSNSNSKDDSNIMVAHNSRNASSRNESNNRTAKTLWVPEKTGILAKLVKPACREANYNRDIIKIRDDNRSRGNRNIMDVISIRTARAGSREVSNSREDSNILQGHQQ